MTDITAYYPIIIANVLICISIICMSTFYIVRFIQIAKNERRRDNGTVFYPWVAMKVMFIVYGFVGGGLYTGLLFGLRYPVLFQFLHATLAMSCILGSVSTSTSRLIVENARMKWQMKQKDKELHQLMQVLYLSGEQE